MKLSNIDRLAIQTLQVTDSTTVFFSGWGAGDTLRNQIASLARSSDKKFTMLVSSEGKPSGPLQDRDYTILRTLTVTRKE